MQNAQTMYRSNSSSHAHEGIHSCGMMFISKTEEGYQRVAFFLIHYLLENPL